MKNLQVNLKVLIVILFFIISFSSCNNEELFILEETALVVEEPVDPGSNEDPDETPPGETENAPQIEANDDNVTTTENISVDLFLYTNDVNIPESITITYTDPNSGSLSINDSDTPTDISDDVISYTPDTGFFGTDSFEYTLCDAANASNCSSALVTITVNQNQDDFATELKAFPTAYGGGAYTTGGRGGTVYHVTNLLDNGSVGSFRWAIAQPRPAIIVFDVSGVIDMQDYIVINGADLTIAGQTAPEGGITFTSTNPQYIFRLWNVENMILRYLRFRFQRDNNNIGIDVYGNGTNARNLIFDHLSISYAGWTGFGCRGSNNYNVTVQNTLFAECKTGAIFGDPDTQSYSYDNSFLNNFFYNVSHRFANPSSDARVDMINNVSQNHTWRLSRPQGDIQLNHINNFYAAGVNTTLPFTRMNQVNSAYDNQIYTSGNIMDKGLFTDPNADNKLLWAEFNNGSANGFAPLSEFVNTPYPLIGAPVAIKTAFQAYNEIITNPTIGCSLTLNADGSTSINYDANDISYLAKTAEGEGAYEAYTTGNFGTDRIFFFEQRYFNFLASISTTPVSSRSANYDTDADGMPNIWETANGYNPDLNDSSEDRDGDGYTNIEEFLNLVDLN